jgi:phage baseplate assembly protein W
MTQERLRLFETDLLLAPRAGGFDLSPNFQGDLAVAQGADNIAQALTLQILVRRGELARLGWPNYGSRVHELIGEPNNLRTRTRLMAFARSAIESDPRVVEVSNIRAEPLAGERDVVRLEMDVLLISQPNRLNLVVDIDLGAL